MVLLVVVFQQIGTLRGGSIVPQAPTPATACWGRPGLGACWGRPQISQCTRLCSSNHRRGITRHSHPLPTCMHKKAHGCIFVSQKPHAQAVLTTEQAGTTRPILYRGCFPPNILKRRLLRLAGRDWFAGVCALHSHTVRAAIEMS